MVMLLRLLLVLAPSLMLPAARALPAATAPPPAALYACLGGKCIVHSGGVPLADCGKICLPPAPSPPPGPPPAPRVLPRAGGATAHPRLYFSAADLPHLRAKAKGAFMSGVLRQYEAALEHRLNYSAGGVLQDVGTHIYNKNISDNEGRGARHQLAASLYVMGHGNASAWGQLARRLVYEETLDQFKAISGNWFAGPQRELEQLVASYDAVHGLFTAAEAAAIERCFAGAAQFLWEQDYPGGGGHAAEDMASRAMNPAADRLGALGLIALAPLAIGGRGI
jgi:hypothetical protein